MLGGRAKNPSSIAPRPLTFYIMDKTEAKHKIEKWLQKIPDSEKDVPYFAIPRRDGDQLVSPAKAVAKLSKDQRVLNYIAKHLVDQLDHNSSEPLMPRNINKIVIEQMRERDKHVSGAVSKKKIFGIWGDRKVYSSEELVKNFENPTYSFGKIHKKAMVAYYQLLLKRLENE